MLRHMVWRFTFNDIGSRLLHASRGGAAMSYKHTLYGMWPSTKLLLWLLLLF
ncbi:hypothetical protein VM1G_00766 [Acetobacter orientalis]|uniref:Uncharacterized protein n=1 Tax=Acetobacter orientalis TaxID=146474 RepID=A0A2Z5ZHA3_9PROT|nr:hypothetical protein VM1G_00766 [Acetobacter orientalis]